MYPKDIHATPRISLPLPSVVITPPSTPSSQISTSCVQTKSSLFSRSQTPTYPLSNTSLSSPSILNPHSTLTPKTWSISPPSYCHHPKYQLPTSRPNPLFSLSIPSLVNPLLSSPLLFPPPNSPLHFPLSSPLLSSPSTPTSQLPTPNPHPPLTSNAKTLAYLLTIPYHHSQPPSTAPNIIPFLNLFLLFLSSPLLSSDISYHGKGLVGPCSRISHYIVSDHFSFFSELVRSL